MYTKNNQISIRQFKRACYMLKLPMAAMLLPYLFKGLSLIWIVASLVAITVLNIVLIDFIIKKEYKLWQYIGQIKAILLAVIGLCVIVKVTKELLLRDTHPGVVLLVTAAVVMIMSCHSIEEYSRLGEILYPLAMVASGILLIVTIVNIDYMKCDWTWLVITEWPENKIDIWIRIGIAIILFVSPEIMVIEKAYRACARKYIKQYGGNLQKKAELTGGLVLILTIVLLELYPGVMSYQNLGIPFVTLLKIVGVPGGFMERQESIYGIFVLGALIYQVVGLLKLSLGAGAGNNACKNATDSWRFWVVTAGMLAASSVILMYFEGESLDVGDHKLWSGKAIENREYISSLSFGCRDDEPITIIEGEKTYCFLGEPVEKVYDFVNQCGKEPDFSHTKIIFLEEELIQGRNEEIFEAIEAIIKRYGVGINGLVCIVKEDIEACSFRDKEGAIVKQLVSDGYRSCNVLRLQILIGRRSDLKGRFPIAKVVSE